MRDMQEEAQAAAMVPPGKPSALLLQLSGMLQPLHG
jgi:hypothetical protein